MDHETINAIESWQDEERGELRTGVWRPETDDDQEFVLRRLAECEAERDRINAAAAEAMNQIEARRALLTERAQRGIAFFTAAAVEYVERNRSRLLTGKRKSVDFLHGSVRIRSSAERIEVTDKDALVAWLSAQPVESNLYRTKIEPALKELQERYKKDGLVPPGMDVKPASESVSVEAIALEKALEGTK
jgi:phage host-nuclease inhibitor protein Gam